METLHNNVTMYEICSQLTIKTPEQRLWRRSGELLLTLNKLNTFFWCFYHWLWISKCWLSNTPDKIPQSCVLNAVLSQFHLLSFNLFQYIFLKYFNFEPSFKLRWCHNRYLFVSQIPVTTRGSELRISCIWSSYLTQ